MNNRKKRKTVYFLSGVLCFALAGTSFCLADVPDDASVSVSLTYGKSSKAVSGAKTEIYYIGTWNGDNGWNYLDELSGCSVDISDVDAIDNDDAQTVLDYLAKQSYSFETYAYTDSNGTAVLKPEHEGLYIVAQDGWQSGVTPEYEEFDAFFISVPYVTDEGTSYNISVKPKTEPLPTTVETTTEAETTTETSTTTATETTTEADTTTTADNSQPPQETTTTNTQPAAETTDSDRRNGSGGAEGDADAGKNKTSTDGENVTYDVTTDPNHVPGGQKGDDGSGHLPITGLVVWPITVFSILGVIFIILGFADNRRKGHKN